MESILSEPFAKALPCFLIQLIYYFIELFLCFSAKVKHYRVTIKGFEAVFGIYLLMYSFVGFKFSISELKLRLLIAYQAAGVPLLLAQPKYCGDNAAMIAGLAYWRRNVVDDAALAVDVDPTLRPGE